MKNISNYWMNSRLNISSVRLNSINDTLIFKNQGIIIYQLDDASLRQAQDKLGSA